MCSKKIANGIAKPVWVNTTAHGPPASAKSGTIVKVRSVNGMVKWAPPLYMISRGIRATCSGIDSSATVPMNSGLRPLKSIQAKA